MPWSPRSLIFRGELFAGELLAFDGEGDDERVVTNMFGDAFALFGLDLPFESVAGMLRCLLVGHFDDAELAIPAQSFRIFRDASRRYFSLTLPTVISVIFTSFLLRRARMTLSAIPFSVLVEFLVELDAGLAVARLDAAGHGVADEQDVVLAGQFGALDGFERFAGGDLGLVVDGDLGAGGDVQACFDHAVVSQGDADAGVRAEQGVLADGVLELAAAGQGAHDGRAAADVGAVADHDACETRPRPWRRRGCPH